MKQAHTIIAETLGWDSRELLEYRYQRYASPAVYAIGDRYYAVHRSKPKHEVGGEWRANVDQWAAMRSANADGTPRTIWVCDMARRSA
jgi:hypothetical protein